MPRMKTSVALVGLMAVIAAALLAALVFSGPNLPAGQKTTVATTMGILAEIVDRLTEGEVPIYTVVPAGVDLHDWEPTPDVLVKLRDAKMLVWLVDGLDDWAVKLAQSAGVRAYMVSRGVQLIELSDEHVHNHKHDSKHSHGHYDPHLWLSPKAMVAVTENIAKALKSEFPNLGSKIDANAQRYIQELRLLDDELSALLKPYRGRVFITQHNAFQYFARDYGLKAVAVFDVEGVEPSAQHVAEIIKLIDENKLKVIFAEVGHESPVIQSIAREKGLRVELLPTGHADITLETSRSGKGYIWMMRSIATAVVQSFG
ncbi:MAG: metal ABC transporter substrate-binding protein [Candidatus Caldarchaeum sp.]|nr:metal ABC transporter substrate-binding protein [Candidatus Caldarchaeum sp.]MDW7977725.1 metal ABC transporter substrate-binding protein [Candidatus Caldarchaeum sp.]